MLRGKKMYRDMQRSNYKFPKTKIATETMNEVILNFFTVNTKKKNNFI